MFGRLSSGISSDRIGPYNVLVITCYLASIFTLGLWIPGTSNASIIMFSIIFGFTSGAYIALAPALVVQLSSSEEIGYRTGALFFVGSFSGLTASPIAGAIIQSQNGSYLGMKALAGVTLLLGTSFVFPTRFSKTGFVFRAKF